MPSDSILSEMFGSKSRKRRAGRRDDRRANRAEKKEIRHQNRLDRSGARQATRLTKADGRQVTKQGMVSAGMNPNGWVSDVSSGLVGIAKAASSYGQAKVGVPLNPEEQEAAARTPPKEGSDNTLLLVGAAAAAYFISQK